jgi:hypothetical protein
MSVKLDPLYRGKNILCYFERKTLLGENLGLDEWIILK